MTERGSPSPVHWPRYAAVALALVLVAIVLSNPDGRIAEPGPMSSPQASEASPTGPVSLTIEGELPGELRVRLFDAAGVLRAERAGSLPLRLEDAGDDAGRILVVEAPQRARFTHELAARERVVALPPLLVQAGPPLAGLVRAPDGAAVAGALVSATVAHDPLPHEALTDDGGRFSIDHLVRGVPVAVTITARGFARWGRLAVTPNETLLEVVLTPVGRIGGRVVDVDGAGAADAEVVLVGSGIWPALTVRSDSDGGFRVPEVPPGVYELRARLGAMVSERRVGLEVQAGSPVFVTLNLEPGVTLAGLVRDVGTEAGLRGAQVTVSTESLDAAPRVAVTGDEGRFSIDGLGPGPYRVAVELAGYVPRTGVPAVADEPLVLDLETGATVAGVVLDPDGRPAIGARIEILGEDLAGRPVALDPSSAFRTALLEARSSLGGLPVVSGAVPSIPAGPAERPFALPSPSATELAVEQSFSTDDAGRFRIGGLPAGQLQLVARLDGFAPASTRRVYVAAGAAKDGLELRLGQAGRLLGDLRDARGDPARNVPVEVRVEGEPFPRVVVSDASGAFTVEGVAGAVVVTARPREGPSARASLSVDGGAEESVELRLEAAEHRLLGRVVDAGGYPVGDVALALETLRADAPDRRSTRSAADGTFELADLPDGPWRLSAEAAGWARHEVDVASADEPLQVVLEHAASLRGRLWSLQTAEPLAGELELVRDGLPVHRQRGRAGLEGGFSVPRLRPGRWVVTARSDGHLPMTRTIVIEAADDDGLDLGDLRLAPAGAAEGVVVDARGEPLAHARVAAEGADAVETDARGRFRVAGLAPGRAMLRGSHPAAGEGVLGNVSVYAAQTTPGLVLRLSGAFDPDAASDAPGARQGVAIRVVRNGAAFAVGRVVPASRAERAGLRRGDQLVAIDGHVLQDLESVDAAQDRLRGPVGVPVLLTVRRGDEEVVLSVERETYLPGSGE